MGLYYKEMGWVPLHRKIKKFRSWYVFLFIKRSIILSTSFAIIFNIILQNESASSTVFVFIVVFIIAWFFILESLNIDNFTNEQKNKSKKDSPIKDVYVPPKYKPQEDIIKDDAKDFYETEAFNTSYSVYIISNKKNKKSYIGMTSNYDRRKLQHFDAEYRNTQPNKNLYIAMKNSGEDNFQMTKIMTGLTRNEALYIESILIKSWSTLTPQGYNMNDESDNLRLAHGIMKTNRELYEKIKELKKFANKKNYT
jgi:predicted GIY-YIG superfamily endonuclease